MRLSQGQPYVPLDHLLLNRMFGSALVWFGHCKSFITYVFKITVMELDTVQVKQQIVQNFEREISPYQIEMLTVFNGFQR
jgi:hypothetical protein